FTDRRHQALGVSDRGRGADRPGGGRARGDRQRRAHRHGPPRRRRAARPDQGHPAESGGNGGLTPRSWYLVARSSAEEGTMASNVEERFQNLHEIVQAARLRLKQGDWDYLMGGAETETTLKRNRLALDSVAFRPRVLRDVSKIDCTSTFLGRT